MNPGWYLDQQDPRVERWWNGRQWTPHVRPAPMGYAPAARPQSRAWLIGSVVAGVAVIAAAVILLITQPWSDGDPTYLRSTSVAGYIERNYGSTEVVCNDGKDIEVHTGKVFSCRSGEGKTYAVKLTDDNGTYQVTSS